MVGLIVLSEESGTDQKQLGTDQLWYPLEAPSASFSSFFSARNSLDPSCPQLVHRSDPELSTIALWTAPFVILFRPETVISFDIMIVVLLAVCQRSVSVQ